MISPFSNGLFGSGLTDILKKRISEHLAPKQKNKSRDLNAGDVVFVDRKFYKHFAVYVGNNEVVHYAPDKKKKGKASIHKAPFEEFLGDATKFTICIFPKEYGEYEEFSGSLPSAFGDNVTGPDLHMVLKMFRKFMNDTDYKLFSPKQTVKRALQKAEESETEYNLLFNNCEHFAIWCKTGIKESRQVQELIDKLLGFACIVH